jgi:hypothetical protein
LNGWESYTTVGGQYNLVPYSLARYLCTQWRRRCFKCWRANGNRCPQYNLIWAKGEVSCFHFPIVLRSSEVETCRGKKGFDTLSPKTFASKLQSFMKLM